MSARLVRVNELLKRQISHELHTFYQAESVGITITRVQVAPDLRHAKVYFSCFEGHLATRNAVHFFKKNAHNIRKKVGKKITLKYLPHLEFIQDHSIEQGFQTLKLLEEIQEDLPLDDQKQ